MSHAPISVAGKNVAPSNSAARSGTAAHVHTGPMKGQNRCADCGGKFGLIVHRHAKLKFCRKRCKDNFLAGVQRDRHQLKARFALLRLA